MGNLSNLLTNPDSQVGVQTAIVTAVLLDEAAAAKPQPANVVLAGPASGPAATPAFRALVSADIPGGGGGGVSSVGLSMPDEFSVADSPVTTSGTLTVTKATLVISASSGSMTYGGTVPAITPGYSGFVNGDTAASLTTQPVCTTAATSTKSTTASAVARPIWNSLNMVETISVPRVWVPVAGSCDVSSQIISKALRPAMTIKTAEITITSQMSGSVMAKNCRQADAPSRAAAS